jgi:hypothetical protein
MEKKLPIPNIRIGLVSEGPAIPEKNIQPKKVTLPFPPEFPHFDVNGPFCCRCRKERT